MSSLAEIHFNYNQAIAQADQLDSIAAKLRNAANGDVEDIMRDVGKAWKSDSTQQYIKKGQKVKSDMLISDRNLAKIADAIRTIARRVRDAELEAWRIANARK